MNKLAKSPEEYLKQPYSRVLIPDEKTGTFTAEILEFPGCISQGDTAQEAYERLEEAAKGWIEAGLDLGQEIPPPALVHGYSGKFALRLPKSLHCQAARAAERDGTSLNQFIVTALAEKIGAATLFDRLAHRLEQRLLVTTVAAVNEIRIMELAISKQATTATQGLSQQFSFNPTPARDLHHA